MEAGDRTAGDGDEQEREHAALPHRAIAAGGELGQRRHLQFRHHHQNADGQRDDRTDLEEGRQVVTRSQQQPHGQHGGDEAGDLRRDDGVIRGDGGVVRGFGGGRSGP
ncbi:hypothetical protein G6F62_014282 [Rhizopus arrhizus]|nr:hypothetical protein G6F62_014282 [Rhizopus arrhizus]